MKHKLYNLSHDFAAPEGEDKPIFLPFGKWDYDARISQTLDRAHGERIANNLNARVARGEPGIPVYQGHPDVPELAAKYPDKGALGWIERIEVCGGQGLPALPTAGSAETGASVVGSAPRADRTNSQAPRRSPLRWR